MDVKKYLELCERGNTGTKVSKDDWDMDYIVENVMDLVDEYEFEWDKQVIIPEDDQLFDDMFEAAKKLILKTGVYNMSTQRIISFTEEEIEAGIRDMKKELVMGEGKDAYTLVAREVEDKREPAVWAGNPGCPTPEELFFPIVKSVAKEPVIDLMTCGSLVDVDGFKVTSGSPSEVVAVRREMEYLHKALEEVGRPGLGLLAAESAVTEIGDLASVGEKRLRPCDSHLVAMFNELIIDNGNLVRAASKLDYGMKNASLACTMVGGMGGDAPGSTVVMIASILAANLICMADYHLCHPIHIQDVATTARGCLWLQAVLCQTFAKKAPAIIVCDIWPSSGSLTKELLYETAANAIVVSVCGGHLEGLGAANGNEPNGTGLEVRLMGEVGKAVARQGMTRAKANEIVLKLLEKYEHIFKMEDKNKGSRFDEAYNMETIEPTEKWLAMYEEVKAELAEMGVEF
ncbi:Monomethylamine methyltransferase MtmB [uncultured Roseburia sp.]|uniref:Monomethylamine:corrinoid methyltransferase n=1 Tax=Brotonthovivens ammoniilytica TaxID=2981725 RepID=A0ABT2TEZ0_9FIRM|nr:monomethylamine:corrinoid methyltransferase [Brotonthovivens ammoniilytica]MCU6760749.1 monomethylamine:corrinoid methyltransferase [Brotonthovivens ammoniilytica]SCI08040.1 Monomethylamine methyltransferase MtmB [uncultured Roseburia sp.]